MMWKPLLALALALAMLDVFSALDATARGRASAYRARPMLLWPLGH